MNKFIATLILAVGTISVAQTTVTVPAPDGTTIKDNGKGVWSCVVPAQTGGAATFPSWITFDNANQTLIVPSLKISGGAPTVPNTIYWLKTDANNITGNYPLPSTSPWPVVSSPAPPVPFTVPAQAIPQIGHVDISVPASVVLGQNTATVTPLIDPGPNWVYFPMVLKTGTITVRIFNASSGGASLPAGQWIAKVQ